MGNYEQLKQSVSAVVKTNGNQEITGANLQNVLLTIISTVGANATFAGVATPATNPGAPDGHVFYIASESGTYTNFNAIELQAGLSVLMWNGSWSKQQILSIDYVPTAGSHNLVESGGVAQAIHTILEGVLLDGKYIENNGVVTDTPYLKFKVTEYDVTGISGYVKIQTNAGSDFPLFSLQDSQGNVIVYQHDQSQLTPSAFLHVDSAAKLYVTNIGHVEFFNNDAITELFKRGINIESDFEDFTEDIENLEDLNIDISQYIQYGKRIGVTGEVTQANYAYVKLPVSLFTIGKTYFFKGKSAQFVPGFVVQRSETYVVGSWGDYGRYTIASDDTYININLNVIYDSLGLAFETCKIAEINKEIYSCSQTRDKFDELINSVTKGTEYNIIEENCEFFINKRYIDTPNTPVQPPIDANGYVCARFTNIDVTKIYAADCISSQYVPGYMLLDENDIILAQGDPFGSVVYNKQILPIKDSSYKTVLLQAKVDTTNVNELTVKNILRLFIKENIKSTYSSGEIDNKLYQRDVKIKDLEIKQQLEEEYKKNQNYWIGKSIAWFGTSIPEGGVWTGGPTYPHLVGKMLGVASTHNEAVGGSCAANNVSGYTTFQYWYIRMGHSVAQNLDLFRDAYTVDYTNQTVTIGPRTMIDSLNLSSVPNITTYAQAVDLIADMAGCSYQLKLVYRYLIADDNEGTAYLNQIFNGYENELNALQNISQWSDYKNILRRYDVDLIVFDHGHNDRPNPVADAQFDDEQTNGIDTTDMSTWLGAMNTYMRLVMFYKPKMRIAQISDYYYGNTVKSQEQFARRWQIPYCEVWKSLPYLYNRFKVTVRGYWDANGIWHDKGFTWTEPTNMSDTNISNYTNLVANGYELEGAGGYGTGTIGALKVNINPRQENGEWVWETNLSNLFMKDGLHPGSDYTWKCVDLYARVLVKFIKGV